MKRGIIFLIKLVKKVLWYIKGGYKPQEFWNSWGHTFMDDPWQVKLHSQHKWFLEEIKRIKPTSFLEVGCGFGRNIKFLLEKKYDPSSITGVDISKVMLQKAKTYLPSPVTLKQADVSSLPFKNNQFDLVFTHGVLMHVSREQVKKSIHECIRVSKKYCIFIEQNYGGNEYTFIHNYKKLLGKERGIIDKYIHLPKKGLDYIVFSKK